MALSEVLGFENRQVVNDHRELLLIKVEVGGRSALMMLQRWLGLVRWEK